MRSKSANSHVVGFFAASALLLGVPLSHVGHASAQSEFDDEFDEEFEERTRDATIPTRMATVEEFDDDESGRSTPSPSSDAGASQSDGDSVTAPRGDLFASAGSRAWRQRRYVLHNTYGGAVGGLHVVDAGSGPSQSFRVQLITDFFVQGGFLRVPGTDASVSDENRHIGGSLSLSYTPFDFLEIYGSVRSWANSNDTEAPNLFQVLGDSTIGVKGYYEILPWFTLGADVSVHLLNTVGDIGLLGDSTSATFRLNAAADLRAAEGVEFPLIARLNLAYDYDRSSALTDRVEQARYDGLPTIGPDARRSYADEDRHLLTRAERFALQINRTDFFDVGLGVELPIFAMQDFYVSPIVEWNVRVPVNSRGYSCLWIPETPGGSVPAEGQDGCLEYQGFAAMPSNLTLGVRVQPGVRGLGLLAAVDIGTSGQTFVRELAGNAPYSVYLGLSYAVDTMPPAAEVVEREVERRVEVAGAPPVRGRILGTVVEQGTTNGVPGAVVGFPGRELTALSASGDGSFASYELEPGEVQLAVSHPEYRSGTCAGTIPEAGGDVTVSCSLEALPRVGQVRGRVVSEDGAPVSGATVTVTGPQGFTATTDSSGTFAREGLPPGAYSARVESDAYLITSGGFEVRPRETVEPSITAVARPNRSGVQIRARELVIRRQINFATDSAEILGDSVLLMTEIADALLRHPELTAVEIQGHTDNRGGAQHNLELSQRRADAVREWLVGAGVAGDRLVARGYGDTRSIASNITAGGRARNRRVQFMITSRAD